MRALAASLLLGASVVLTGTAAAQIEPPPKLEDVSTDRGVQPPIPAGWESDVYCAGWVGSLRERFSGSIISAELVDSQRSFVQGDIVYLNLGAVNDVKAGDEFWVVRPTDDRYLLYKPGSETETIGRVYQTPGRVRVICAQEKTSIAEITASCSDIAVGDSVDPFEPIPIPLVRRTPLLTSCDEPNGKPVGHIVGVRDNESFIATDTVVYLNLGEREGLLPGDFLSVYRYRRQEEGLTSLRTVLGEVVILTTREKTAVAKVANMRDTMEPGDQVEVK